MEQRRANADWRTHACVERDTSARVGDIAGREVAVQQRIYAGDGGIGRQPASYHCGRGRPPRRSSPGDGKQGRRRPGTAGPTTPPPI